MKCQFLTPLLLFALFVVGIILVAFTVLALYSLLLGHLLVN